MGGAVFNQGGTVVVTNSTITGNAARGGNSPGAGAGSGFGGGVFNLNGLVTLTNVTVAGNTVAGGIGGTNGRVDGGAVYNLSADYRLAAADATPQTGTATLTVANSILAGTTGGAAIRNARLNGPSTIHATGPNITTAAVDFDTGTTTTGTPFTIDDPALGPLRDNGGPSPTMLPLPGSPAVDAGSNAAAAGLSSDQRGGNYARVANGTVDLGAAEIQAAPRFAVGRPLAAGGRADGSAVVFTPAPTGGGFNTDPAAALAPFGTAPAAVRVATADVDGDRAPDTILVTGPGVPLRVVVVSGADNTTLLVTPFDPFGGDFPGGGYVAAADLDGDGRAEFVVTPDQGGGPRVTVFTRNPDGRTAVRANFLGIDDPDFRGGARAALGDVNGDGVPEVVVAAGFGGGPRTAVFTGQSVLAGSPARLVSDFFAFPGADAQNLRNGSFVAAADVTGDGFADLVFGGGPGGAPRVFALSGALVSAGQVAAAQANPVANFFVAGDLADRGGARVAVTNADGDGRADVAAGSGAGRPAKVRVYLGKDFAGGGEPPATDLNPFGGAVLDDGVYVG